MVKRKCIEKSETAIGFYNTPNPPEAGQSGMPRTEEEEPGGLRKSLWEPEAPTGGRGGWKGVAARGADAGLCPPATAG